MIYLFKVHDKIINDAITVLYWPYGQYRGVFRDKMTVDNTIDILFDYILSIYRRFVCRKNIFNLVWLIYV